MGVHKSLCVWYVDLWLIVFRNRTYTICARFCNQAFLHTSMVDFQVCFFSCLSFLLICIPGPGYIVYYMIYIFCVSMLYILYIYIHLYWYTIHIYNSLHMYICIYMFHMSHEWVCNRIRRDMNSRQQQLRQFCFRCKVSSWHRGVTCVETHVSAQQWTTCQARNQPFPQGEWYAGSVFPRWISYPWYIQNSVFFSTWIENVNGFARGFFVF